jgi:Na+/H+ antiporter
MHHGPELVVVLILCVALAIGAVMRMLASRVKIPYTIAMLLIGLGAGLLLEKAPEDGVLGMIGSGAHISPDLIIFIFLPALVFESAYSIRVHSFLRNLGAVAVLAVPALLVSTGLTAAVMVGLTGGGWEWGWIAALTFGALISATDPVAVVALLRELGAPKRLALLIEGESLLNDGTAIVVFSVLVGLLSGSADFALGGTIVSFLKVVSGGIGVGLLLGWITSSMMGRVFNDPLVEITLTVILAYAAMVVAEAILHVSGVMAIVTAGLWMSGPGKSRISPEVMHFLHRFWEMLAYLANTLIFFLVGLVAAGNIGHVTAGDLGLILVAYGAVVAVRFLVTFSFRPLMGMVADPVTVQEGTAMAWGGLRGAVSLALALIVSQHHAIDHALGEQILLVTAGVVLLTILVNGSTMGALLKRFGLDKAPPGERLAGLSAQVSALQTVTREIEGMAAAGALPTVDWQEVLASLAARREEIARAVEATREELQAAAPEDRERGFWQQVLSMERQAYWSGYAEGTLGARATAILDHDVDLRLDRLAARGPESLDEAERPMAARVSARLKPGARVGALQFDLLSLQYDLLRGEAFGAKMVLHELDRLTEMDDAVKERIRASYLRRRRIGKEQLEDLRTNLPEVTSAIETRLAERIGLNLEREQYESLSHEGVLDPSSAERAVASVQERMKRLMHAERTAELPETADLVRNAPLFSGLDDAAIEQLAVLTRERVLSSGDVLFRQGDAGDSLFIIARGAVHVLLDSPGATGPGGEVVLLDVLGGGDLLGEMALLSGEPRTATIKAATTVTVGEIARGDFEELMKTQPAIRDAVWNQYLRRMFDNTVRIDPSFEHLGHADRLAWFDRGAPVTLETGEGISLAGDCFLGVGVVTVDGEAVSAPALLRGKPGREARAETEVRLISFF